MSRQLFPSARTPTGRVRLFATLVRYTGARNTATDTANPAATAVLYLHGYTDYFFQRHLAEHFADLGYAFYALDLRKCGRSSRPGQTPHYTTDLARYDLELGLAIGQGRHATRAGRCWRWRTRPAG